MRVHGLRPAWGGALACAGTRRTRGVWCHPSQFAAGSAERPGRAGAPSGTGARAGRDSCGSRRAPADDGADGQTAVGPGFATQHECGIRETMSVLEGTQMSELEYWTDGSKRPDLMA